MTTANFWTFDNIRRACGGNWLSRGKNPETSGALLAAGLSTDSRSIRPGQAFLALHGDRFNGHDFLEPTVKAGASLLIVDDETAASASRLGALASEYDFSVLRVADTGKALMKLAGAFRKTLERTRVVAVLGSNGKTTTTRLITAVLASSLRGTASAKSFNNSVGVPLTILSASPSDQFLICEVGTNAPGEIAALAEIVRPDVVVVTSIGREHLEGFGTLDGVAREEGAVFSYLAPGALAIVPSELPDGCDSFSELLKAAPNIVRFGRSDDADLRASGIRIENGRLTFLLNGRLACTLKLLGEHNAVNALAAVAVGRRFGIDEQRIVAALAEAKGPEMRLEVVEVELGIATPNHSHVSRMTFLNDAYNANPDSTLASLRTFETFAASCPGEGRRIAVLGDMLELGESTQASHAEIGRHVASMTALDRVVLIGPHSASTAAAIRAGGWPPDRIEHLPELGPQALTNLGASFAPGDVVLLKGSRGMRLERIIEAVRNAAERHAVGTPVTLPGQAAPTGTHRHPRLND